MKKIITLAVVALTACGQQDVETSANPAWRGSSPLESTFDAAAKDFAVPVELLKGIAYVETRISDKATASASGGHGLMNLVQRDDWKMVDRASALTHVSAARVKLEPKSNVLGAAAVLRELADASFRSHPELNPHVLGDWYLAVSMYPGIDSATLATDWASEVFLAIEQGFEVSRTDGTVAMAPTFTEWRKHAPVSSRTDALGDGFPTLDSYQQSPHYSAGRTSYQYIVIHTMQGSYSGSISWFKNPSSNVSAHYLIRSVDGHTTQMVQHGNTAWHAQCYNGKSIGIEHEGFVQDPAKWYTDAMYTESAKLTRWIADKHGIPRNRSSIIGHAEVAPGCNTGGHTDPGSGWNWTKYMSLVNGTAPTPTNGVLIGAIYTGGNSANRVSGAAVTVNGQTVTTGADGIYQFNLAPGSYTASVSKSGFGTNSVMRTVTAGAQAWGSMEINPVTATGALKGKIYQYNAANPSDLSVAISGAVVTANGQTQTTGADGMYSFTFAPGTYTVTVAKTGFANNSVSRTVTSGGTVWGSVGLSGTSAPDQQAPQVAITFPMDKAVLELAQVTLTGTASDDKGAVATVSVQVNAGAAVDVPVSNGKYSIDLLLAPGTNSIKVSAKDAANNVGTVTQTATFSAGLSGFVHVTGDESARVKDAQLELLEASSPTKVSTATSDATGQFSLGVMKAGVDYRLIVKASGFVTYSETVTVPVDQRLTMNVGLTVGEGGSTEVAVIFTDPVEGGTITTEQVTVYGAVTGFEAAGVTVNGAAAELLGAGGFSATIPLVEGENTLEAIATGVNGESAKATMKVIRKVPGGAGLNEPMGSNNQRAKGGCSSVTGLGILALGALLPLLRRRASKS